MKDQRIIELFFARDERALEQTTQKYSDLCHYIASSFLMSREDREECINDALLALWNNIPPDKPDSLSAYLAAVIRNIAISRARANNAWKRTGNLQIVSDEFLSMLEDGTDLAADYDSARAGKIINEFLDTRKKTDRKLFVMRYWLGLSISQIATQTGFGESKIKTSLMRTRRALAEKLRKEGIFV